MVGLTDAGLPPSPHRLKLTPLSLSSPACPLPCLPAAASALLLQVLLELIATRREERGIGSRYTSLAVLESIK
jgi:hypothetical protein